MLRLKHMTREEIKNKVTEIVADKMGFSVNGIKESTSFKYDLGTDSLDEVELIMEFERKFSIEIKDEEIMSVSTVGEAIDVICQKLGVSTSTWNAIKIEINLDAVNTMTADELKTHLIRVRNSVNLLNGHISDVKEKITNLAASSFAARWPFKEGQLVKVTVNDTCGGKPYVKIGYFLRFGKPSCYILEGVFLILSNVKTDGTMGKRTTDILAKSIINIEPYEIPYVGKK